MRAMELGDSEASAELAERGWLPEQGYGAYGTGRNLPENERTSNRQSRRGSQRVRSSSYGGQYVPDNTQGSLATGPTRHRAAIQPSEAVRMQHTSTRSAAEANVTRSAVRSTYGSALSGMRAQDTARENAPISPTFGVELEFIGSSTRLYSAMLHAGLDCEVQNYNHHDNANGLWKIVPDGSVSNGAELVSPILSGDDGFRSLRKACAALQFAGCTVDRSTGLHVHHGASGMERDTIVAVARAYTEAQQLINTFLPVHRVRNGYARAYDTYQLEQLERHGMSLDAIGRYMTVNLCAIRAHGTIEFRQHNGSNNYQSVANWVRLGQRLIANVIAGYSRDTSSLENWLASLDCEARTVTYYTNRAARQARREARPSSYGYAAG